VTTGYSLVTERLLDAQLSTKTAGSGMLVTCSSRARNTAALEQLSLLHKQPCGSPTRESSTPSEPCGSQPSKAIGAESTDAQCGHPRPRLPMDHESSHTFFIFNHWLYIFFFLKRTRNKS
jgi:hypothetical protein